MAYDYQPINTEILNNLREIANDPVKFVMDYHEKFYHPSNAVIYSYGNSLWINWVDY